MLRILILVLISQNAIEFKIKNQNPLFKLYWSSVLSPNRSYLGSNFSTFKMNNDCFRIIIITSPKGKFISVNFSPFVLLNYWLWSNYEAQHSVSPLNGMPIILPVSCVSLQPHMRLKTVVLWFRFIAQNANANRPLSMHVSGPKQRAMKKYVGVQLWGIWFPLC